MRKFHFASICNVLPCELRFDRGSQPTLGQQITDRNQREIYYKAVIKPVILYGANIWTSTSKGNINSIFKLQKRAARIILDAEPRSRSVPLFNLLNWIPFYHESYAIRRCLLLKRILGKTPVYLKQMLKLNSDTHNRSTCFKPHLHYRKIWVRTQKKVGTGQIFLLCKWIRTRLFLVLGP